MIYYIILYYILFLMLEKEKEIRDIKDNKKEK